MKWAEKRSFQVIGVGAPLSGPTIDVSHPGAGDPFVELLVETHAAELVAAELWQRRASAGDPALVDA
jgi:hypothetical protein